MRDRYATAQALALIKYIIARASLLLSFDTWIMTTQDKKQWQEAWMGLMWLKVLGSFQLWASESQMHLLCKFQENNSDEP